MTELAPIIVFAYNRPYHLSITLDYLKKNSLAGESNLYFFSDGEKNEKDKSKIEQVREIILNTTGFKNITHVFREKNYGLANSVISGVNEIFKKHNSVIVIEDDLMTSADFLSYMNDALLFYENEKSIFTITGYSLPLKRKSELKRDVFFSPRAGSWGWATWKDRWGKADWNVSDYETFRRNKTIQKVFNHGGADLTPMLKAQMNKKIDSWAIRWCYTLFRNHGLCVYPVRSKVKLIEEGGGGTHVKDNSLFRVELDDRNKKTEFTTDYSLDEKLLLEMNDFMKPSLIRKVVNYFKYDFRQ